MKIKNTLQYLFLGILTPCWLLAQSESSTLLSSSSAVSDSVEQRVNESERMELSSQEMGDISTEESIPIPLAPYLCGVGSSKPIKSSKVPVAELVVVGEPGVAGVTVEAIVIGLEAEEATLGGEIGNNNKGIAMNSASTFARGGGTANREAHVFIPSAPRAEVMFRDNETKEGEEQEDVMTDSEVIAAKRSEEQAWAACVAAKKNLQQCKDEFTLLSNKGLGKNSDAEVNLTKAIQAETAAQVTYSQAVQSLEFCKDRVGKAAIFRAADRAWMEADAALVATNAAHAAKKASTAASQARQAMLTDAAMEAEARVQPALQRAHEAEEFARIVYTQATEASYEEAMRQKGVVKGEAFWTDKCVMNAETAEQAVAELNRVPDHAAAHRAADRAEFIAAIDRIVKLQVTNALVAKEAKTAEIKRALEAKKILQSKMTTKEEKAAEAIINERREEVTRNAKARAVARREIMDSCSECPEKTVEYLGKAAYVSAIVVGGSVAVGTCPIWSPILLLHYCYNSDEWDSCLSSS